MVSPHRLISYIQGESVDISGLPSAIQRTLNARRNTDAFAMYDSPNTINLSTIGLSEGDNIGLNDRESPLLQQLSHNKLMGGLMVAKSIMEAPDGVRRMEGVYERARHDPAISNECLDILQQYGTDLYFSLKSALTNLDRGTASQTKITYELTRALLKETAPFALATETLLPLTFLDRGIPISKDPQLREKQIAICGDTSILLHQAISDQLFSGPAKTALIPEGYFESLALSPYFSGGNLTIIPTRDTGYKLSAKKLEDAIMAAKPGTYSHVILTSPTNPTGQSYSAKELRDIGRVAVTHGLKIMVDEHFAGLNHPDQPENVSIASLRVKVGSKMVRLFDHSITVQGSSKVLDCEDYKVSMACSGDTELIRKVNAYIVSKGEQPTYNEVIHVNTVADTIDPHQHRQDIQAQYTQLKRCIADANKIAGQDVYELLAEPTSGFFAVVTMPREVASKVGIKSHQDLFLYTLLSKDIKTRSIEGMGIDDGDKVGMRVNFTSVDRMDDLPIAFSRLGKMAKDILEGQAASLPQLRSNTRSELGDMADLARMLGSLFDRRGGFPGFGGY